MMRPPCFCFKHITPERGGLICRNAPPAKIADTDQSIAERIMTRSGIVRGRPV